MTKTHDVPEATLEDRLHTLAKMRESHQFL